MTQRIYRSQSEPQRIEPSWDGRWRGHDRGLITCWEVGSRDWIHSTHGRKIEKAIEFKQDGYPIAIISEQHWLE